MSTFKVRVRFWGCEVECLGDVLGVKVGEAYCEVEISPKLGI